MMEVHGYISADNSSISATIDDVLMSVPNDMANRHRQMIADWEAMGQTIPPYVEPDTSGHPYRLFKSVFIDRMTDAEAVTMEGVLAAASPKLRLKFNSVEYFISDDPLFSTLHDVIESALSPTRANQLLAPE